MIILPIPMSKKSSELFAAVVAFPFLYAAIWYRKAGREEDAVRACQIEEEKLVQDRFRQREGK